MTPVHEQLAPVGQLYGLHPNWLVESILDLFGALDFTGKRLLDVGAGSGLYTCCLASLGAAEVVAIEPEMEGATEAAWYTLLRNVKALELQNVSASQVDWQNYFAQPESFDCILMVAVVNHLDEERVQTLHMSPEGVQHYAQLLQKAYEYLKPGGTLVLLDSGRSHVFKPLMDVGLFKQHPVWKGIEWEKHQDPEVWIDVLRQAGFSRFATHWAGFTRFSGVRFLTRHLQRLTWIIRPFFVIRAVR